MEWIEGGKMKAVIAIALILISAVFGLGALTLAFNASQFDAPTNASAVAQSEEPMSTAKEIVQAFVKPKGALAPDITSATWLNSPVLAAADLRGRVVVVEFWTHG